MKNKKLPKWSNLEKEFLASAQCRIVCGDGSGKRSEKHVQNCPYLDNLQEKEKGEVRNYNEK